MQLTRSAKQELRDFLNEAFKEFGIGPGWSNWILTQLELKIGENQAQRLIEKFEKMHHG